MKRKFNGHFSSACDIGKVRKTNEDEVKGLINQNGNVLLVVCDGIGGVKNGGYASKLAMSTLVSDFSSKKGFFSFVDGYAWLLKEGKKVNKLIFDYQAMNPDFHGIGTTLVCVLIIKNKFILLNVGDSRCYLLQNQKLSQITEDQTYVNYLLKSGLITKEEALTHPKRHYLTNCVGMNPSFSCDIKVFDYKGESIMLCSDGLYNNVSFNDLEANLNTSYSCDEKVRNLVDIANNNGGSDNISIILWECFND